MESRRQTSRKADDARRPECLKTSPDPDPWDRCIRADLAQREFGISGVNSTRFGAPASPPRRADQVRRATRSKIATWADRSNPTGTMNGYAKLLADDMADLL